ncbi:FG-GAP repeat domain-containing protein [Enhygromyxa salina]|uniref:FG-GAP repeat domain-containing protein n=1 Tax=Enhygromyxa salina TaxID=215803 RepID=UPI0015E60F9C|nr:FG-GAP and VCBS repeat-containing protein [Enhygromyxa salina]
MSAIPSLPSANAEGRIDGAGGDRFGFAITSGDLDSDGQLDLVVTAPHPSGGNQVYVFSGPLDLSDDLALDTSMASVTISGPFNSETGWSVAVGDINGDGNDDLVVASPNEAVGAGNLHIFEGPLSGGISLDTSNADHSIVGGVAYDYLGWSLTLGDFDDDGVVEIGAGACGVGSGVEEGLGAAYIFDLDGPTLPTSVADATATFKGSGKTGCALASADFNDDGADELVIGSYGDYLNTGLGWGGSAAIVYGRAQFDSDYSLRNSDLIDQDIALIRSELSGSNLGFDLASGDLNGDGHADLILGAPSKRCYGCSTWDHFGRTYVVLGGRDVGGPNGGRVLAGSSSVADVSDIIYEDFSYADEFGRSVASPGFAGPVFGDTGRMAFGAPVYGPLVMVGSGANTGWGLAYDAGARYQIGPDYDCTWNPDLGTLTCDLPKEPNDPRSLRIDVGALVWGGHRFEGGPGEVFGFEVHGADFDADGLSDLVFGASHQLDFEDPAGDGKVFLFQGR